LFLGTILVLAFSLAFNIYLGWSYMDARQKRTQRVIEPLHLRRTNGELLLIAHCKLRDDRRTFKLDRIVQLTKVEKGGATATAQPRVVPVVDEALTLFDPVVQPSPPTEVGGPANEESLVSATEVVEATSPESNG